MLASESLTLADLQPLLHTAFAHAAAPARLTPLAADASTRRYFRLSWQEATAAHPASCVIMRCAAWSPASTPDFVAVAQHLRRHGVTVPHIYSVDPEAGLMCLEDYGDCALATQWQQSAPAERLKWGQKAVDQLVLIHTQATYAVDPACPAFHLAFDIPKLVSELQFFRDHALQQLWGNTLVEASRAELDAAFHDLCTPLAAAPRFFCHRDYHGWNVMAWQRRVGVLDFQDARMGPQPYDLVSLLLDRGTPEILGEEVSNTLMEYYLQCWQAQTGQSLDSKAFAELFDYAAIQRCLKATGTFAAMHGLYQRSQYLPYIPPTLHIVKMLLGRYYALQPLRRLLQRFIPSW